MKLPEENQCEFQGIRFAQGVQQAYIAEVEKGRKPALVSPALRKESCIAHLA